MASYTTVSEVSAELGGTSIASTTTPSLSQVQSWISDASKEVEELTGRVWSETTVTSTAYEYSDYDGCGIIYFDHQPVISVQSIEYESQGLGATTPAWSSLVEGRDTNSDFVLYKDEGFVKLFSSTTGKTIRAGIQNIRKTYTYGYTVVPAHIKRLTTLLVAKRYIASVANSSASSEGGSVSVGTISVSDPNNYVHLHQDKVNKELDYLRKEVVSTFKPRLYTNRAYD